MVVLAFSLSQVTVCWVTFGACRKVIVLKDLYAIATPMVITLSINRSGLCRTSKRREGNLPETTNLNTVESVGLCILRPLVP